MSETITEAPEGSVYASAFAAIPPAVILALLAYRAADVRAQDNYRAYVLASAMRDVVEAGRYEKLRIELGRLRDAASAYLTEQVRRWQ